MKGLKLKKMVRFGVVFTLLWLLMFQTVFAAGTEIPDPTPEFYVNDFANVFSEDQRISLIVKAEDLAKTTDKMQVVITTMETLNGEDPTKFANEMYKEYQIGENDMGALILLLTQDREIKVQLGKNVEPYLSVRKLGSLVDENAIPYLANDEFAQGLISLQEVFIQEFIAIQEQINAASTETGSSTGFNFMLLWILIGVGSVIALIVVFYHLFKRIKESEKEIEQLEEEKSNIGQFLKNEFKRKEVDLNSTISSLERDLESLKVKYRFERESKEVLEDWKRRVLTIDKEMDEKVNEMIAEEKRQEDQKVAKRTSHLILSALELEATKENYYQFSNALDSYSALTKEQLQYVEGDIDRLKDQYSLAKKKKLAYEEEQKIKRAKEESERSKKEINRILSSLSSDPSRRVSSLKEAMGYYDKLSAFSQQYFDLALLGQLRGMLEEAERREREEEERRRREEERRRRKAEEERRRRNSYHSSSFRSSSGSSSSHSHHNHGFGGTSRGAGVGRKF